jgi:D-amino-acid oxidase
VGQPFDERNTADKIIARCAEIEPRLLGAEIVAIRHGTRPKRSEVRVELDTGPGHPVVHNYGHGGSGLTLSWGCAFEVRDLVLAALDR